MRSLLSVCFLLGPALTPRATASDTEAARQSLRGLKEIEVVVDVEQAFEGLNDQDLKSDLELRCRQAGLRVNKALTAYLAANVNVHRVLFADGRSAGVYSVSVSLELKQYVSLERDPKIGLFATTWSVSAVSSAPPTSLRSACRDYLRELVDKFLNGYLEQNPK